MHKYLQVLMVGAAQFHAAEILAQECQLADGYLGTYEEKNRWTAWDVWAHKYNLLGLLTYMRYTGNQAPLATCRRMADMLCQNLGTGPDQRDIITAGAQHVGMASTSVLEPMVLLYRLTGEQRYLDFCHYIVRAWEQPNGPHIVSRLLAKQGVNKVGNGKAYEMLSCLNGALELYRTEGDRRLLEICLNAWQDIVDKRLYLTGAASIRELFRDDHELPNTDNVGETCVTVTWLQFNAQLLRLTGEARFAEQLERVVLNQLLGAQQPDCTAWGYYVQMEGMKPYSATFDGHCCLSSGPRGVALIPTFAVSTDADGLVVNLYDSGTARLALRDGTAVTLTTETLYPSDGRVRLKVDAAASRAFAVKLRIPAWDVGASARINGAGVALAPGGDGYAALHRTWAPGDAIELNLPLAPRVVAGDHLNPGKAAILYGPLVLAADDALLVASGEKTSTIHLPSLDPAALVVAPEPAPAVLRTWPGAQVFAVKSVARKGGATLKAGSTFLAQLVPFADAGATGSRYRVWLPLTPHPSVSPNLLLVGEPSVSGPVDDQGGKILDGAGAINSDNLQSAAHLLGAPGGAEAWFAVALAAPVSMGRIVYVQGPIVRGRGWFDTSARKPRIQIQRIPGGVWETVGELADYPATSAGQSAGLVAGRSFEVRPPAAVSAIAVRVCGMRAGGGAKVRPLVACGELQAFAH